MAFTAGSVELARATRLGQKLSAYHNSISGGITTGRDEQLINKYCRNGRFTACGFTSGKFPINQAATHNVGLTLGVIYKTAGATNGVILSGNVNLYGTTASINMVTGTVS